MLKARKALSAVLLAVTLVLGTVPAAFAWPIDEMNKVINQTNFILDGICSATLIDKKLRLVLTNYHCVDEKITTVEREETFPDGSVRQVKRQKLGDVTLSQKAYSGFDKVGEASYVAEIVAHKKTSDLALLRIKAETIPHNLESRLIPDGQTVLRGTRIYSVGNPRGLDASVVEGIISSTTRVVEVPWAENEKISFYQISGGLAGGNSGGALYNDKGQLIGVPAMGYRDSSHLGFAITDKMIKDFLKGSCYEAAYNSGAKDPETCKTEKKAELEKRKVVAQ